MAQHVHPMIAALCRHYGRVRLRQRDATYPQGSDTPTANSLAGENFSSPAAFCLRDQLAAANICARLGSVCCALPVIRYAVVRYSKGS